MTIAGHVEANKSYKLPKTYFATAFLNPSGLQGIFINCMYIYYSGLKMLPDLAIIFGITGIYFQYLTFSQP